MTRWEYWTVTLKPTGFWTAKLEDSEVTAILNNAGREGWELAAAPALTMSYGQTGGVLLLFKRPSH
ncbi:MAG: DUF4177 domain-containing protein [Candidatus Hydrogenedentes bacterium]|nr:DUF4177 domain-containing protein [Candidatus Hydrogenedentota bacterium]